MNYLSLITLVFLILTSCGGNSAVSEKELELREKELELRERELALQESASSTEANNSSNQSNFNSQNLKKSEADIKKELARKECENRMKYLGKSNTSLTGIYKNALSLKFEGFKVKFNIQNSATLMTYKNVRCRITLSSNSGSTIVSKNFTVNEFIRAGSSISYVGEFACTNQEFKDTDKYNIELLDAQCH